MYSTGLMTLLYPLWCYIFVVKLDLGVIGSSMCSLVSIFILFLSQLIFAHYDPIVSQAVQPFSFSEIGELKQMWKLGSF